MATSIHVRGAAHGESSSSSSIDAHADVDALSKPIFIQDVFTSSIKSHSPITPTSKSTLTIETQQQEQGYHVPSSPLSPISPTQRASPSPTPSPASASSTARTTETQTESETACLTHRQITSLRRLSRKLPPVLTESLENLARITPPPPPISRADSAPSISALALGGLGRHTLGIATPSFTRTSSFISETSSVTYTSRSPTPSSFRLSPRGAFSNFPWSASRKRSTNSIGSPSPLTQLVSTPTTVMPSRPIPVRKPSSPASSEILVTPQSSVSASASASRFNMLSLSSFSRPHGRGSISSSSTATSSSSAAQTFLSATSSSSRYAHSCTSRSGSVCGTVPATWSIADELDMLDSASRTSGTHSRSSTVRQETRKERKERQQREKAEFDSDHIPDPKTLFQAGLQEVVDEHGKKIKFADLVKNRRTIVIFIRHWFCPLCAQYMNSILADVSLDALEEANVDLVIIGNGSDKMLDGYRNKAFRCPFKMYTDPSLSLYRSLGLTRQTGDSGPEEEKGDYLIQTGLESTVQTIKRATKMPLRNPGHFTQLGGEFVFETPLSISFAHRMINTRSHTPIRDVCAEAGVRLRFIHYEPGPPPPPVHRQSFLGTATNSTDNHADSDAENASGVLPSDQQLDLHDIGRLMQYGQNNGHGHANNWQKERDDTLTRMKALKAARREGFRTIDGQWRDPRSRVDEVKIVGRDIGEEEVVLDMSALGYSL